jgi:hypothetical protein
MNIMGPIAAATPLNRLSDLVCFYALLDDLREAAGGTRTLASLGSFRDWPRRGVYFFFESSELRSNSGASARVIRVGTHALTTGSRSTFRQRLKQHRGAAAEGGHHRGSIFRLLIGQAMLARGDLAPCRSWGVKGDLATASRALNMNREEISAAEAPVERAVTQYLGTMPFLWLNIDDEPGPDSLRCIVERNAIALLSNYSRAPIDPPSPAWLGRASNRPRVRGSGLWNQNHVEETYDPAFLDTLEQLVAKRSVGE